VTSHSVSLAIAKMIRDGILVDDGFLKPCLGDRVNPQWAQARAANIATAIAATFDCRPNGAGTDEGDEQ
jgi:hypothetical protein